MHTGIEGDGDSERELETLCRSCGLCCDGSLFGRVGLDPTELDDARKGQLRVLSHGAGFEQPCSALHVDDGGCACLIYAERPRSCRTFICRLYDRHRRERGPIEVPLYIVRRVRTLLRLLDRVPAHQGKDARKQALRELSLWMEESFARA